MSSILERAQKLVPPTKSLHRFDPERIEASLAWLRGDVELTQLAKALGRSSPSNVYIWLAIAIKQAFQRGMIIENHEKWTPR